MPLLNNEKILDKVIIQHDEVMGLKAEPLVWQPFYKDFTYRLCWSSNAIEGNTLSLDETISVIEYDEVSSGHTYTEYQEAKNLYQAIQEISLDPMPITEEWIQKVNGIITGTDGKYRTHNLYVGTLAEATYYPPNHKEVSERMSGLVKELDFKENDEKKILERIALQHIQFERIHPFGDGNGRVGRILLNQQLLNHGFLPIAIDDKSRYNQSFRRYDHNGDVSLLVHLICKGELNSIQRIEELGRKYRKKTW